MWGNLGSIVIQYFLPPPSISLLHMTRTWTFRGKIQYGLQHNLNSKHASIERNVPAKAISKPRRQFTICSSKFKFQFNESELLENGKNEFHIQFMNSSTHIFSLESRKFFMILLVLLVFFLEWTVGHPSICRTET